MDQAKAIWIKDPVAVLANGAECGIVVRQGRIVELVAAGRQPATADIVVFDASDHAVLPGLINTHHHFYQTLTRAMPRRWIASCFHGCRRSIRSGRG